MSIPANSLLTSQHAYITPKDYNMTSSSLSVSHDACPLCNYYSERQQKKTATQIEMTERKIGDIVVEPEVKTNSLILALELYPCIEKQILRACQKKHLPRIKTLSMVQADQYYPNVDYLLRLCFLTTIVGNVNKLPVTKEEAEIFAESHLKDKKTGKWLGWRAITSYAILATSSAAINFLGYAKIANDAANTTATNNNSTNQADSDNKIFETSMIFLAASIVGIMTNWAGLWWTGRNPDASSIVANKQQNRIHLLHREYFDLAMELINLYYNKSSRPLAKELAKEIDVQLISKILDKETHYENASQLVSLQDLEAAIEFINSDRKLLPRNAILRMHINFFECIVRKK
jgi:hypothetical protein